MKKILVAVDGSEGSLKAVALAAELSRLSDVPLRVTHVVAEPAYVPSLYADTLEKILREAQRHSEEVVDHAARMAEGRGARCERVSLSGPVAETVVREAEHPDIWMVAVGSHGRNPVARVLLGSVADRVVHTCPKPVLVVK